jgi:anti-sigma factor ChrR (cupin superfamily)
MANIITTSDPDYWTQGPEWLAPILAGAERVGVGFSMFMVGEPSDESAPLAAIFRMPPNWRLPKHRHPCHRVEVVLSGEFRVGERVLGPGDVSVSGPNEYYGPHVAGPEGCVTVEIFSRAAAVPADYAPEEGPSPVGEVHP